MKVEAQYHAKITVERSRFLAVLAPAGDEGDIKKLLTSRRRAVKKACHHCWASRVLAPNEQMVEQARDDGEVGRPGYKILELLRHHDLNGVLVVSRIFGGVKLGPAGVGRAFKQAAQAVLSQVVARP